MKDTPVRSAAAVCAIVLSLCVGGHAEDHTAGASGWEKLDLASTTIAGAAVHYEKCFEAKLTVFEKLYKEYLARKQGRDAEAVRSKMDPIIADINRILGVTEPETDRQRQMLAFFLGAAPVGRMTFYLVSQKTTKDFLRAGGQLPNYTYDKATDTAEYRLAFQMSGSLGSIDQLALETSKSSGPVEHLELAFSPSSEEAFEDEVGSVFQGPLQAFTGAVSGGAIHEVAEMSLLLRVRFRGRRWRWFSDGVANVMTVHLLKKHIGDETAGQFLSGYDTSKHEQLEKQINLRYWLSEAVRIESPVQYEEDLRLARYAYATLEVQRLVDAHGIECIGKILDEVCTQESRTSRELMAAIQNVTGEDMAKRLARYQSFLTPQEGLARYSAACNAALPAKDYEQAFINLMRVRELRDSPYSPIGLDDWSKAGLLLVKMGHEEVADSAMRKCVKAFSGTGSPEARGAAMDALLVHALRCGRPQTAVTVAEDMLTIRPDHVLAHTVQMLTKVADGEVADAKELARRIIALTEGKGSRARSDAEKVLAIDEDSPAKTP